MADANKKMKRVKITSQTTANGEPARVGDVIDMPENEANILIGAGFGVETKDAPKKGSKPVKKGSKPTNPPTPDDKTPAAPGADKA